MARASSAAPADSTTVTSRGGFAAALSGAGACASFSPASAFRVDNCFTRLTLHDVGRFKHAQSSGSVRDQLFCAAHISYTYWPPCLPTTVGGVICVGDADD